MGKARLFVVLKTTGFKYQRKPKAFLLGKLSHRDANQPICKYSLLEIHLSKAQGWPHRPGAQSYTPHQKLTLFTLNTSLL